MERESDPDLGASHPSWSAAANGGSQGPTGKKFLIHDLDSVSFKLNILIGPNPTLRVIYRLR